MLALVTRSTGVGEPSKEVKNGTSTRRDDLESMMGLEDRMVFNLGVLERKESCL